MNTLRIALFLLISTVSIADAQTGITPAVIDDLNRAIDQAVVHRDIALLQKHYGEDFVFTHGTGTVDSKESWLKSVQGLTDDNRFISREHDSTRVELHGEIAIITGKLSVVRLTKVETKKYALRYVRVYALRKNIWQLISHRTTHEWHL
jgi:ketosteroid isomerase-like protein